MCGGNKGLLDVGVAVLKRINYVFSRGVGTGDGECNAICYIGEVSL